MTFIVSLTGGSMGRKTKIQLDEERQAFFAIKIIDPELVAGHTRFSTLNKEELCDLLIKHPNVYQFINKTLIPKYKLLYTIQQNIEVLKQCSTLKLSAYEVTSLLTANTENFFNDDIYNFIISHSTHQLSKYDITRLILVYHDKTGVDRIYLKYGDYIIPNIDIFGFKFKFISYINGYIPFEAIKEQEWLYIFESRFPSVGNRHNHKETVYGFIENDIRNLSLKEQKFLVSIMFKINKTTDPIKYRSYFFSMRSSLTLHDFFALVHMVYTDEELYNLINMEKLGTMGYEDIVTTNIKNYIDFSKIKNKVVKKKLLTKLISTHFFSEDEINAIQWDTINDKTTLEYAIFLAFELGNWLTVEWIANNCNHHLLTLETKQKYGIII